MILIDTTTPGFGIPYALIGAVFGPLAAAYLWLLRNVDGFRFAHPYALALIPPAVALVLWAGLRRAPGRRGLFAYSRAGELALQPGGLVARLRDLPVVLRLAAVVLTALARPQTTRLRRPGAGGNRHRHRARSVIDAGGGPGAEPPRGREDGDRQLCAPAAVDRIGLVVFGREAYVHIPLTLDHGTYLRMLSELKIGIIDGRATAIGNGIGVALNRCAGPTRGRR